MKKKIQHFFPVFLILVMMMPFIACGGSDHEEETPQKTLNPIIGKWLHHVGRSYVYYTFNKDLTFSTYQIDKYDDGTEKDLYHSNGTWKTVNNNTCYLHYIGGSGGDHTFTYKIVGDSLITDYMSNMVFVRVKE